MLTVTPSSIAGVVQVERLSLGDSRGWLQRIYCADELRLVLGERSIAQVNRTFTANQGTVRGLHFQQAPAAETKVVTCVSGRVFDVAVDLRRGSTTFLSWHAEILDSSEARSLIIPEGCAHGFQSLTPNCEMLYLHTAAYSPEREAGVSPTDPVLGIPWPQTISEISNRDASHKPITPEFSGIIL